MQTKYLILNNCRQRNVVKEICKHLPWSFTSKFLNTLLVKAIYLGDSSRLVITSGQMYAFWVTDLQRDQQRNGFDRVVSPVDEVSHEQVISKGDVSSDVEELDQVVKLSMYISTDGDRCSDSGGIAFLQQNCCCFLGDQLNLLLCYGLEIFEVVNDDI